MQTMRPAFANVYSPTNHKPLDVFTAGGTAAAESFEVPDQKVCIVREPKGEGYRVYTNKDTEIIKNYLKAKLIDPDEVRFLTKPDSK
jgi:hypothetical protein